MKKFMVVFTVLFVFGTVAVNAQFTILLNFNGTNGAYSWGTFIHKGNTLYGMTTGDGISDSGNIFSIDTNGNGYRQIFSFHTTNGKDPMGTLTISGNKFYGMTLRGGANDSGCIWSVDTNGSGYKDMFDFNGVNGVNPYSALTISGGKMFGMTHGGGMHGYGRIFSIDTNGNNYKDLLDFNDTNGANPWGGLTLGNNGVLYGMVNGGGEYNYGRIFSIDTNGNNYKSLWDFNDTSGANPYGDLTYNQAGTLYGMASNGGAHKYGCVFSIDTNGNKYHDILNFNDTNGANPYGAVTIFGNRLYGMTPYGGALNYGSVFSVDTDGRKFIDLHEFNGANGKLPIRSLLFIGNSLFGMTNAGGTNNDGIAFKIDTNTTTSINELKVESGFIYVFPNPSDGKFTVMVKGEVQNAINAEVFNILGEKVYSRFNIQNPIFSIDLSDQQAGVYFCRITTKKGDCIGKAKLVIEK